MQFNKYTHTHVSLIPPWEDQREWHRMTRMTRPDCAVMCNLINTHTHTHRYRMTRMTGPDCAVMRYFINTYTQTDNNNTTTEVEPLFDSHPRHKNMTLLLNLTIFNTRISSNLENAARYARKHLDDAIERKKTNIGASSPLPTLSFLSLYKREGARRQAGRAQVVGTLQ